jgi:hypothetical protein
MRSTSPRTRRALGRGLVVGLLAMGFLAGCGGDDDDSGEPTGTSTEPQTPLVVRVNGGEVDMAGVGNAKPLLADGIKRFAPPSAQREVDANACHVRWGSIGLFAIYANLGGREPCDPQFGRLQGAALTNARWRTAEGLAYGDPEAKLHELYPDAVADENRWTIASRKEASGGDLGLVSVVVQDGRISSMQVYVGAAGD